MVSDFTYYRASSDISMFYISIYLMFIALYVHFWKFVYTIMAVQILSHIAIDFHFKQ